MSNINPKYSNIADFICGEIQQLQQQNEEMLEMLKECREFIKGTAEMMRHIKIKEIDALIAKIEKEE